MSRRRRSHFGRVENRKITVKNAAFGSWTMFFVKFGVRKRRNASSRKLTCNVVCVRSEKKGSVQMKNQ